MRARRGTLWLAPFCCVVVAGCGLTLDYGPPDMDAGHADANVQQTCATGCDDGLRCTADACQDAVCVFTDLCPNGTDCVDRGSDGECRRACVRAGDCDDHIDCTRDFCDPADGHCAHASTCDGGRPVCLDTGACAPDHCETNEDCSDGDLCTGAERCVGGSCRAGAPVVCEAGTGCTTQECDPNSGTCGPVLHDDLCIDTFDCTTDVCNTDGSCANDPDPAACASDDRCVARTCNPTDSMDSSGCVDSGGVVCPDACGASISCEPTTGLCDFTSACPAGQVCRADGCRAPGSCNVDGDCLGIRGPGGCATFCQSHVCQPLSCPLPMPGSCAALATDSSGCPSGAQCYRPQADLCQDSDDLSIDSCDPGTFVCTHTCPAASSNDCVTYTYVAGHCIPSFDASVCAALHPGGPALGCARYACVGHDPTTGSGADGCALVGSSSACDDLAACTDDVCTVDASSRSGTCSNVVRSDVSTLCSDGVDCTTDTCTPGSGDLLGCSHTPMDAVCTMASGPLECASIACARGGAPPIRIGGSLLPSGCTMTYMPGHCGLLGADICTLDGQCTVVACGSGTAMRCDDGTGCNGTETCNVLAGHCTQVPLVTFCAVISTS